MTLDTATMMAMVDTALITETKTAAAATEGTMVGCDDHSGSNRVDGSENNNGNKGAIGNRGSTRLSIVPVQKNSLIDS